MTHSTNLPAELICSSIKSDHSLKQQTVSKWTQNWLIKPLKRMRSSMELRRKIEELDDHMLRDVGLHETTYAAECKMRREHNILHLWL